jgi:RimJ/RimL family protein N-acetyltransferase
MEPETLTLRDDRKVLIRGALQGDGAKIHAYLMALGSSTPFIMTMPGCMREVEVYEQNAQKCVDGSMYVLNAIDPESGDIVGVTSFHFGSRIKTAHTAEMGTGVLPGWQGVGLGSWMLDRAVADFCNNPWGILRLGLTVMSGNEQAQRMYEKAGFVIEGTKPRSIRQPDGTFNDEIVMGMWIGEGGDHD